eukprot:TRINITY_DN615_c0_g1_i1.p3 TRINITY_DN615_c0_g1~~TRINITY_DN615_c0_g1_i1.p3  ORF type:complete len:167 (+),score=2.36 TRINITY_DN615_c0_g1_i1:168-668(+)
MVQIVFLVTIKIVFCIRYRKSENVFFQLVIVRTCQNYYLFPQVHQNGKCWLKWGSQQQAKKVFCVDILLLGFFVNKLIEKQKNWLQAKLLYTNLKKANNCFSEINFIVSFQIVLWFYQQFDTFSILICHFGYVIKKFFDFNTPFLGMQLKIYYKKISKIISLNTFV